MSEGGLDQVLAPRSIAVIGASRDPRKRGYQSVATLLETGFPGPIYPVNAGEVEVCGLPAYPSVGDIPSPPDLALVATPAATVPGIIADCGQAGVRGAIVLAVGFGESGPEGARLEADAVRAGREAGVRLIGPSTSGLINVAAHVNLVGVRGVKPGELGIVSQSGNLLLALMLEAETLGEGLSFYVGPGNQADVGFAEYLEYLTDDSHTRAITVYCEGFRRGRATLHALQRAAARKPVCLLKGGESDAGRRAALSHTGALAGSGRVARDLLRQAGATVVGRSDELLPVTHALARCPPARGGRVALLVDGGGQGTIAADALSAQPAIRLAALSAPTKSHLRDLLPPAAAVANPVDVAGATDREPGLFAPLLEVLVRDPEVDLVVLVGIFGGYSVRFHKDLEDAELETAERLAQIAHDSSTPLLLAAAYDTVGTEPLRKLRESGIPVYASIETAVTCANAIAERGHYLRTIDQRLDLGDATANGEPDELAVLTEPKARRRVEGLGLSLGRWEVVRDEHEAASVAERYGTPVAMKVVSPQVSHKTDVGGVRLGIEGAAAAARAYRDLVAVIAERCPAAVVEGMLMSPMAPKGAEVLIGLSRDPTFGPVITVGVGGVLAEQVREASFCAAPITRLEAEELLERGMLGRLLNSPRAAPSLRRCALIDLLVAVSRMPLSDPAIAELDLNPVIVHQEGVSIVDVRVVIGSGAESMKEHG